MLTVYIGYDDREQVAYDVLVHSIEKYASKPVNIQPIKYDTLKAKGLINRPLVNVGGRYYDTISNANAATQFAISRFMAPVVHLEGWAVFMDCDMVLQDDIYKLMEELDPVYAVQCVKHDYIPKDSMKMDGQAQENYHKKNWSSFFAFNSSHPSMLKLDQWKVENWPGRYLHGFGWLTEDEIGPLSPGWNWLVGEQPKPETLYNAHFTLGGPWFDNWHPQEFDYIWSAEFMSYSNALNS